MALPNFLVIGAAKSGTSSLWEYMKQHPDVYVPKEKEPRFFGAELETGPFAGPGDGMCRVVSTLSDYEKLFEPGASSPARGEASPSYLYNPNAAVQIRTLLQGARLIVVLRNPVDRAYSHYLELVRDRRETISDFTDAIRAEPRRIKEGWHWAWHYTTMGFYYPQLKRYFELFPRSQIRIYLHEQLNADSPGVLRDLFGFLGVDEGFTPDVSIRHHRSGIPRHRVIDRFLQQPNAVKAGLKLLVPASVRHAVKERLLKWNLRRPALSANLRSRLTSAYREDIERVQELTGLDLGRWLAAAPKPRPVSRIPETAARVG